jgi:hypothetical protein
MKKPTTGHVVKEYTIGNSQIRICDDAYVNKTPEDIERTLKRITAAAWDCVLSARKAGIDV